MVLDNKSFRSLDTRPLRRFVMSRPVKINLDNQSIYPEYKTIIYEISGVRKKMMELVEKWPPGDYILGMVVKVIVKNLIREGYKGKMELRVPWHTSRNINDYITPRHNEPTKLYHAFYQPYEQSYQMAQENGIEYVELTDYPPENENIKTYYSRFIRTKRGEKPKLEKKPPADNIPETQPNSGSEILAKILVKHKENQEKWLEWAKEAQSEYNKKKNRD